MKITRKIQIIMLSAVMSFVLASPAFSALSTQATGEGSEYIEVDAKAHGTKLTGVMTIYYANAEFGTPGSTDMHVFLRLRVGKDLYGFMTVIEDAPYNVTPGIAQQQELIEAWVTNEVIPELYCPEDYREKDFFNSECCNPADRDSGTLFCAEGTEVVYPTFAIKSTDQAVAEDSGDDFITVKLPFTIMDVVIAVQD